MASYTQEGADGDDENAYGDTDKYLGCEHGHSVQDDILTGRHRTRIDRVREAHPVDMATWC